jgi:hypothetical protein
MKVSDYVVDVRTAALVKVVKAFTLAEDIEARTARSVNHAASAIRALAEAGEIRAAGELAERLGKMADNLAVDEPALDWARLVSKHCDAVARSTGPRRSA